MNKLRKTFHNHINNVFGWKTKRKIVVIESDDWGSIRMSSKESFNNLLNKGIAVDKSHYNLYDGLESNADLEGLFGVLSKHTDKSGRHPVFTGANIVANPDFEKIRMNNFKQYYYERVQETYNKYGESHNKVLQFYKEGIDNMLFVPAFHGREHLNINRWMKALQRDNKIVHYGFKNKVTGIPSGVDMQAAFAVDDINDIQIHKNIISEGLELFNSLFGFKTSFFIPPNGPFNASSYLFLKKLGIRYLNSRKYMVLPDQIGKIVRDYRYSGMQNKFGQLYFIRNCYFEPSSTEHPANYDWINNAMKELETAFLWRNPAIFSSHRVNYIGWLNQANRTRGLTMLDELLTKIIKRWPDVEFMTTMELGDLINAKNTNA